MAPGGRRSLARARQKVKGRAMRFGLALLLTVWVGTAAAQEATTIHFGAGVEIVGQGATFDLGVLQITAPGRYAFSGELGEGAVLVDAPGAVVELVLNG